MKGLTPTHNQRQEAQDILMLLCHLNPTLGEIFQTYIDSITHKASRFKNLSGILKHNMQSKRFVEAIEFAGHIHRNQKRKLSENPYITHPLHVATIVAKHTDDEDVLIAALLHDTIEDSEAGEKVTTNKLAEKFGDRVAEIVDNLTIRGEDDLDSKQKSREKILSCSWESKLIKCADIMSNTLYNLFRLDSYSKEDIESVLGENLSDVVKTNLDFVRRINFDKKEHSKIAKETEELLNSLKEKINPKK